MEEKRDKPLEALYIFSAHFVIQHVSDLIRGDLFTGGAFMDTSKDIKRRSNQCNNEVNTHPTMVTPMGHGALPIDRRR
jgi:hypothetical protein